MHSLLITRYKITRYSLQKNHSLLVAKIALCKKSFATCRKTHSLLVIEVVHSKKSLVTCCKIRLLVVAEVSCCKILLVTRCKTRSLLVAENNMKTSTNFLKFLFNVNNIFLFDLIKYDNCYGIIFDLINMIIFTELFD